MTYATDMVSCGMIYLPGFMKIGPCIQAILFCLRNLNGCNAGITDGRDILSMPLRWDQVT
jgi:hypothetical protein